jgi:hypothetical protein
MLLRHVHHWGEVQFTLLDLHHGFLALIALTGPWAFTLLVLLGFGALTDVVSRLPTIIAATVFGSIVVVSWGCTRLVGLLLCLTVPEISTRLVLRRGHSPVSSWRWLHRNLSTLLDKAKFLARPTSSSESGLPLPILLKSLSWHLPEKWPCSQGPYNC